jgi:hypothetical protein
MNIREATRVYESWLAQQIETIKPDLDHKHRQMAAGVFPFFRATFYRWMQLWPDACRELANAPHVLAVGDLHIENFGTWRDQEGRLIWGVNDFDEAFPLPWTLDLVRLATSACLAIQCEHLSLGRKEACNAILAGYTKSLSSGGSPIVLAEEHVWLRKIALGKLRDPVKFWKKMAGLPAWHDLVPEGARDALVQLLPDPYLEYRIAHRVAGLGSLGRQRFVALAQWKGGIIAREAKASVPSACTLTDGQTTQSKVYYQDVIDTAIRARDPLVGVREQWIVRRLAPDCCRVELSDLPQQRDETKLLYAMGCETANIHLGSREAQKEIVRDLDKRTSHWLSDAAKIMVKLAMKDWAAWRKG